MATTAIGQARRPLTARQREVLNFVRAFAAEQGYPPTVREIGAHFGFVPRSVFDHLKALERKGYLRRRSSKSRSLMRRAGRKSSKCICETSRLLWESTLAN